MPITVVVDLQLGDCGKGKIVDLLAADADVVFRWNGGGNAGHHIINDRGEFKLHHVPAGVLSGKLSVLGNGMVIDPVTLLEEINNLKERGIAIDPSLLMISERAHIVFPWHKLEDAAVEAGAGGVGSTKRGIAYAYADKMRRTGMRFADFKEMDSLQAFDAVFARMGSELHRAQALYGECAYPRPARGLANEYVCAVFSLLPYVCQTEEVFWKALRDGKHLLGEGAQGYHLDIDFGRYPFVTSSSACAGGIYAGAGIPPTEVPRVIGVAKAYTTYVGTGPFPTELTDYPGPLIQEVGKEFGTTTGRKRRVGWFDCPMASTAVRQNGVSEVYLTKLDVLTGISELKIATSYHVPGGPGGYYSIKWPATAAEQGRIDPFYVDMKGWAYAIGEAKSLEEIRQNAPSALEYVKMLSSNIGARISAISVGPHRGQTFFM